MTDLQYRDIPLGIHVVVSVCALCGSCVATHEKDVHTDWHRRLADAKEAAA